MQVSFSDVLSIIAIIIALYSSTTVVRKRSQKDYFINQFNELNSEYRDFVSNMRNSMVSAPVIQTTLSYFTNRIITIYRVICSEYSINDKVLESAHNELLWNLTDLDSIQTQYESKTVCFSSDDMAKMLSLYADVEEAFLKTTVQINLAKTIAPWERPEENLGY